MAKKIILDCDPGHDDAVAILLALGNPEIEIVGITTVGGNQSLEKVTYNALCTPEVQRRIEEIGTPLAVIVSGLMDFFRKTYQDNQDFVDPPVHDPCTVAYLIDPSVVQTRRCPLDVELHGELTLGMTVADLRGPEPSEEECHTQVATKLDFDKFWNLVIQAIENIG